MIIYSGKELAHISRVTEEEEDGQRQQQQAMSYGLTSLELRSLNREFSFIPCLEPSWKVYPISQLVAQQSKRGETGVIREKAQG